MKHELTQMMSRGTEANFVGVVDQREAARILGMSESWLKKRRVIGGGPAFIKVGRLVKYMVSDLEEFIGRQRRWNTSNSPLAARQPPAGN